MKPPLPLYDITPFTLLDFPGKTACIFWFSGCNMRCPYCYNPDILFCRGKVPYSRAASFLESRTGLLDGVIFSGGECTLHPSLFSYAELVKDTGMLIKTDTNGSRPDVIAQLLESSLLDYVALDFKAPERRYKQVSGRALFNEFHKTLHLLIASEIPFEVRTTVHPHLLDKEDILEMTRILEEAGYRGTYYLQQAIDHGNTLNKLPEPGHCPWLASITSSMFQVSLRNTESSLHFGSPAP
ncbi:anaerobic ribonucleoside-triphosphate reductase activating protein [Balneolaceae bacterium ANBcel3]|nr:anaerobic ribonucleoside-triphosphate reductase activating protein [Balneolaceae bacterium ANBcel3]